MRSVNEIRRAMSAQISQEIENFLSSGGKIQVLQTGEGSKDPTKIDQHVLNRAQREFASKRPFIPATIRVGFRGEQ